MNRHQTEARIESSLFGPTSIKSMLVSDARDLLKKLNQDSTGMPWLVKERLQNTLHGLPKQMLARLAASGDKDKALLGKGDDDVCLEMRLQAASVEMAKTKQEKTEQKYEMGNWRRNADKGKSAVQTSSVRDKYMDKLHRVMEKSKQKGGTSTTASVEEAVGAPTSAGLSTWIVNAGANEVLSYSDLRGLFKAIIPPRDPLQDDEYKFFLEEIKEQFDLVVPKKSLKKFPDPGPILAICKQLGLRPTDLMVLARHSPTIKAAKQAGMHVCHYMPGDNAMPNHTAHYHLTHLHDYQHLIEDFNGISYRDKITVGSIEF